MNRQEEAIRLRREEGKSNADIAKAVGASRSTVLIWLKDHPLTPEQQGIVDALTRSRRAKAISATMRKKKAVDESKYFKMAVDLSPNLKGRVAEIAVCFRLTLMGYRVFQCIYDGDVVDILTMDGDSPCKIQVKMMRWCDEGRPLMRLHRMGGKGEWLYKKSDVDVFVGYDLKSDTCFVYDAWPLIDAGQKSVSACEEAKEAWQILRHCSSSGRAPTS